MTDPCGHSNSTHPSGCWYIAVVEAVAAERGRIKVAVEAMLDDAHELYGEQALAAVLRIIEGGTDA
jgi:hypothetical protein